MSSQIEINEIFARILDDISRGADPAASVQKAMQMLPKEDNEQSLPSATVLIAGAAVYDPNTRIEVNTLSHKTVLAQFSTSCFTGNKKDKRLTAQMETANHISENDRVSGRKYVMKGKRLDAVRAAIQRVRQTWESATAPWLDGGFRIVSAKRITDLKIAFEAGKREVESAVDALIDERDEIVRHDRQVLNSAFNSADYPRAQALRGMFQVCLDFHPVETDFRTEGIDQSVQDEIARSLFSATDRRIKEAKADLLARLTEKLAHLSGKLAPAAKGTKTRLHDCTLSNVFETCGEVSAANFDDDTAIAAIVAKVEETIKGIDLDAVRDSEEARNDAKETAEKALQDVQDAMAGFTL